MNKLYSRILGFPGFFSGVRRAGSVTAFFCLLILVIWASTCWSAADSALDRDLIFQNDAPSGTCRVEFSYFFHRQPRMASNQMALWIEDPEGNYIATVFATAYTAQGGYKKRPLSLPQWRSVSDWDQAAPEYVDAVSGATPLSGRHEAIWDCRDEQGLLAAPGRYVYRMEGNIFWENMVLWTGEIIIGDFPDQSAAEPVYFPERAHRKGIMLDEVRAKYEPE